jgi:hypothetical protein
LLSGMLYAMRPRPDTDQGLVLSVFRDGLRRPPDCADSAVPNSSRRDRSPGPSKEHR